MKTNTKEYYYRKRDSERTSEKIDSQIKMIKDSKKIIFTTIDLIKMSIFYSYAYSVHLKIYKSGPKFFKDDSGTIDYYYQASILDWLEEMRSPKKSIKKTKTKRKKINRELRSFFDLEFRETIDDINMKINTINIQPIEDFNVKELVHLGIFYNKNHAIYLRKKGLPKFHKPIYKTPYKHLYKKYALLDWLKDVRQEKIYQESRALNKEPVNIVGPGQYPLRDEKPIIKTKIVNEFGLQQVIEFYNELVNFHNISHNHIEKFGVALKKNQGI